MNSPTVPAAMKVISLARLGAAATAFEPVELAVPRPAPGEFLVRVSACGVCGHDALARRGKLAATVGDVLGHEVAGLVVAAGSSEVDEWVGQRVALVQRRSCGRCADCRRGATAQCRRGPGFYGDDLQGGYAEYIVADPLNSVRLPDGVPDDVAAIASCGIGTGLHALRKAELAPGDVIVITGAGGGVGLNAVRTASALGLRVIACTGDDAKSLPISDAGADTVLVKPDVTALRDVARAMDRPRGADAVIEVTGGPTFATSLRALAPQGRLVLVGNTVPAQLAVDPGLMIVKELQVIGSAHATRADLQEVIDMLDTKRLDPMRPKRLPLREASTAHVALDERSVTGRTVLIP